LHLTLWYFLQVGLSGSAADAPAIDINVRVIVFITDKGGIDEEDSESSRICGSAWRCRGSYGGRSGFFA
jgi:hypothetical protein